jgi:zinc protease
MPGPATIQRRQLDNGLTILVYENPASASVVLEGLVRSGAMAEPAAKAGMADFTADLLMRGTAARTFDEIFEALESVGAGLSFGGGRHVTQFAGQSLVEDLDLLLDLLAEALCRPVFPPDHVEHVRGQAITGLHMRANDTRRMARLAFNELLYGDHPYGRSLSGYLDTMQSISRDDLIDFHASTYGPRGMILTVVGAVSADEVFRKVDGVLGAWKADGQRPMPEASDVARPAGLVRRNVPMPEKVQCDIVLGLPGPRRSVEDYLDASMTNTILGVFGMMGRIGQNVRETRGLAYYASSRLEGGMGPGAWSASAGVAPHNVELTIEAIRDEVRRIQDEPVPVAELGDTQAYRIGSMPVGLETNSGLADVITDMEYYELGLDYLLEYPARVRDMTPERIQAAARKYLSADQLAIAVAGPVEKGDS